MGVRPRRRGRNLDPRRRRLGAITKSPSPGCRRWSRCTSRCSFDLKIPARKRAEVARAGADDQRAIVARPFRPLEPRGHRHVPPRPLPRRRRAGERSRNAARSSRRRSRPARTIIRRSSSSCGPAAARKRRWNWRCSRPTATPKAVALVLSVRRAFGRERRGHPSTQSVAAWRVASAAAAAHNCRKAIFGRMS